jgi:cell wall-associated NlpC family hydrolase
VRKLALLVLAPLALAACSSTPPAEPVAYAMAGSTARNPAEGKAAAARAADNALKMLGKPYRFGGAGPAAFDCSGLVMFSYKQAGVPLPHNTEQQRRISRHIQRAELRRGDLLFFDQEGKKNSHVGIYLGGGKFVHAPSTGKHVRADRLDNPYWKKHLSEVRRIT